MATIATELVPADSLKVGDVIVYNSLVLTVTEEQSPLSNQFGLPWFKYRVEDKHGKWGYAKFGPTGTVPKVVTEESQKISCTELDNSPPRWLEYRHTNQHNLRRRNHDRLQHCT